VSRAGSHVDECRMSAARSLHSKILSSNQDNATPLPLSIRTIKRNVSRYSWGTSIAFWKSCITCIYFMTPSPRCIHLRPTDVMRCSSFSPLHGAKLLGSRSSSNTIVIISRQPTRRKKRKLIPICRLSPCKCSLFEVAWPQELSLPPVAFHPQRAGCPMMRRQSPHVPLTTRLPRSITRCHTKSGPLLSPRWTYQGHDPQKRQ
jgi:hypothetical protein